MSKTRLLLLLSLTSVIALTSSCKKRFVTFNIDYTSEVTINSTFGQLVPITLYTPDIQTNSEFEFEANNTRSDKIEQINLTALRLNITSPDGETFSFLNSVEVFISSPNHDEKKVAFKENIPDNVGSQLTCDLVDVELQDFIKDDKFTLRLVTVTDETIPQDVTVDIYTNFKVSARLLG